MAEWDHKATLQHYLQIARDALVWKLEGLSEYDVRRPLVPTGTNLLGLVKHVASVESGYLGEVFGRPFPEPVPWLDDDAEANADMYATAIAAETRDQIIAFYQRVWAHSDATIDALAIDAEGTVSWWPPEHNPVTLDAILVHMIAETNRHAGHADLVRELIDGSSGLRADNSNLPDGDIEWWREYRQRLEDIAVAASSR